MNPNTRVNKWLEDINFHTPLPTSHPHSRSSASSGSESPFSGSGSVAHFHDLLGDLPERQYEVTAMFY